MKYINADRDAFVRAIISLSVFSLASILFSVVAKKSESIASLIVALFFFLCSLLALRVLNRGGARVTYENGVLTRRGCLFGFSKSVAVADIERVVHLETKQFGNRLYLIDTKTVLPDKPRLYLDPERKNGVISFAYSEKNLAFLREFFRGEIESSWERRESYDS